MKYILTIIFSLMLITPVRAATLYLEPETASYGPGDSFKVSLKIGVEECINTVSTGIKFPADYLDVVDFVNGESILSIWLDSPKESDLAEINKTGIIKFSGGIPGGYCGMLPGDPGDSNKIGEVVFSRPGMVIGEKMEGDMLLEILPESKVLLNDGLGTEDELVIKNSSITASDRPQVGIEGEKLIKKDFTRPEPFVVELYDNVNIYQGKYYIIFNTVDKQSGIDHYEVMEEPIQYEIDEKESFFNKIFKKDEKAPPKWQVAEIPYLLNDQTLNSVIKVKAVDRNNNERLVEFIPPREIRQEIRNEYRQEIRLIFLFGILTLIFLIILIFLILKHKKSHVQNQDSNEDSQEDDFQKLG